MNIYIGTDHAGFQTKEKLKEALSSLGHKVFDLGAHEENLDDDYPDFVIPVAHAVLKDPGSKGIVLGGSGQGEAIAVNRIKGIRATVFYGGPKEIVMLSREHNDANMLSIGARFVHAVDALEAVKLWLNTPFSKTPRHMRRNRKIDE